MLTCCLIRSWDILNVIVLNPVPLCFGSVSGLSNSNLGLESLEVEFSSVDLKQIGCQLFN